jgi:hypothetical protein
MNEMLQQPQQTGSEAANNIVRFERNPLGKNLEEKDTDDLEMLLKELNAKQEGSFQNTYRKDLINAIEEELLSRTYIAAIEGITQYPPTNSFEAIQQLNQLDQIVAQNPNLPPKVFTMIEKNESDLLETLKQLLENTRPNNAFEAITRLKQLDDFMSQVSSNILPEALIEIEVYRSSILESLPNDFEVLVLASSTDIRPISNTNNFSVTDANGDDYTFYPVRYLPDANPTINIDGTDMTLSPFLELYIQKVSPNPQLVNATYIDPNTGKAYLSIQTPQMIKKIDQPVQIPVPAMA